ncbi:recombination mediator RecR [Myxococcota bacterium]|nr:recombination mediator RecR [Myxococcota bacterium]MBU1533876.1 recombination mediator RecR [Myxococcota bacterium]
MQLESIERLILAFSTLPGIGKKSARRLTFFLLDHDPSLGKNLSEALLGVYESIDHCPQCGFYKTREEPCSLCSDLHRDTASLCVVSKIQDCIAIESSNAFLGQYHILGGTISPLDGVSPKDLRIDALFQRIADGSFTEIVLALDATVDGETTAQYLYSHLDGSDLRITRIAAGIPFGTELEYTDRITISRALNMRRDFSR